MPIEWRRSIIHSREHSTTTTTAELFCACDSHSRHFRRSEGNCSGVDFRVACANFDCVCGNRRGRRRVDDEHRHADERIRGWRSGNVWSGNDASGRHWKFWRIGTNGERRNTFELSWTKAGTGLRAVCFVESMSGRGTKSGGVARSGGGTSASQRPMANVDVDDQKWISTKLRNSCRSV